MRLGEARISAYPTFPALTPRRYSCTDIERILHKRYHDVHGGRLGGRRHALYAGGPGQGRPEVEGGGVVKIREARIQAETAGATTAATRDGVEIVVIAGTAVAEAWCGGRGGERSRRRGNDKCGSRGAVQLWSGFYWQSQPYPPHLRRPQSREPEIHPADPRPRCYRCDQIGH